MNTAKNESSPPVPAARRAAAAPSSFPVAAGSVAPVGRRVAAFALDSLVVLVAAGIGYAVVAAAGSSPAAPILALPLALALVVGAGQWIAEARTGATVGNALTGIRTVSASTGRPAGFLAVLVRQLVIGVGALVCAVGQWVVVGSGAWDHTPAQRGWHDKAAGTLVLRASAYRRSATTQRAAGSVAWSSAVARAVEPVRAPEVANQGTRASSSDGVGLVPPVPVLETAPLAPAPPPVEPASAPTWAVPVLPQVVTTPPVALIRSLPDSGGIDPAYADDPPPSAVGAVIDTPAEAAPAAPRVRRDRTRGLVDDLSPDLDGPSRRLADEDLGELEHTRLRTTAQRGAGAGGLRLLFDTGEQVDVTGDGLVGRNPGPEPSADHVLAIDDPERSISKVHLAFGLEADGLLWVMDRGSTNGTVVVGPDGRTAALVAGSRATVAPGWTVRFGRRAARVTAR